MLDKRDNATRQKIASTNPQIFARNEKGYRVGASHHLAKCSDADVRIVLELRNRYGMGYKTIAKKMELSVRTVRDWCSGKRRGQLPTH